MDNTMIKKQVVQFSVARANLVMVIGFTVLNFALIIAGTDYYFLFSAIMPIVFVYDYPVVAIVIIAAFFLCWLFSERLRFLLVVGFALFVVDCLFLILLISEYGFGEFWLDTAFHIWVIIMLLLGVVACVKLRGVSKEDFKNAKEKVNAGPGVVNGIQTSDAAEDGAESSVVFPSINNIRCPKCGSSQIVLTGVKGLKGKGVAKMISMGSGGGGAVGALIGGVAGTVAGNTIIKTTVLKYQCGGCREKFEALPHETKPEDVLETPFTVTFTKKVNLALNEGVYVYVNGIVVAVLEAAHSTITFQTAVRHNTVFLIEYLGKKVKNGEFSFDAIPGGSIDLLYNRKEFRAE